MKPSRLCKLTDIAALTVLVAWQTSVGRVVAPNHSSIVIDDCIQVINGGLLHLIFHANTELAQVQVPKIKSALKANPKEENASNGNEISSAFTGWESQPCH